MKVCVDIQAAVAQRAGVGRYTKSLAEQLGRFAGSDSVRFFYFDFKRRGAPFPTDGAEQRAVRWLPGRLVQGAWKTLDWPPFDWFAGSADLYHFPNFIRPPLGRGRSVVTIHDLAFLRHPETIEPRNYRYLTSRIADTLRRVDAVIAVSEFTAREIRELLKMPADRVYVVWEGLEEHISQPQESAVAQLRKRLQLTRPYLLTVGTLEPRKNLPFLIQVFERLRGYDGDLVICGMKGWKYEPTLHGMRASPRASRIRYLDYVPDGQLNALYAGADLFLFPSLYEGFGFPPLEAMACKTPVVCSTAGSLPEILGAAAEWVPEFDAERWAAAIEHLLGDSKRMGALRALGLSQARKYTWKEAAGKTWDVYRKIAG
jgi:glycosyltransferase involved in cell wall biosynthesis